MYVNYVGPESWLDLIPMGSSICLFKVYFPLLETTVFVKSPQQRLNGALCLS